MADQEQRFLQIFHEVMMAVTSIGAVDEVLGRITREVRAALNAKGASIRLLNPRTQDLELRASDGLSREYLEKGAVDATTSIAQTLQGESVWVEDAWSDPRVAYPEANRREGLRSILSVPLMLQGHCTGALRLYFSEARALDPQEIEFVEALGVQAAVALRNAQIYEDLNQEYREVLRGISSMEGYATEVPARKQLAALRDVARETAQQLDPEVLLPLICRKAAESTGADASSLRLLNPESETLDLVASHNLSDEYLRKGPVDVESSIRDALVGQPVLVEDAWSDPRVEYPEANRREGIRSILSVPMKLREEVIGVLRLYYHKPTKARDDEIRFSVILAEECALVIENARLVQMLREMREGALRRSSERLAAMSYYDTSRR